jgi:hypothetical protein
MKKNSYILPIIFLALLSLAYFVYNVNENQYKVSGLVSSEINVSYQDEVLKKLSSTFQNDKNKFVHALIQGKSSSGKKEISYLYAKQSNNPKYDFITVLHAQTKQSLIMSLLKTLRNWNVDYDYDSMMGKNEDLILEKLVKELDKANKNLLLIISNPIDKLAYEILFYLKNNCKCNIHVISVVDSNNKFDVSSVCNIQQTIDINDYKFNHEEYMLSFFPEKNLLDRFYVKKIDVIKNIANILHKDALAISMVGKYLKTHFTNYEINKLYKYILQNSKLSELAHKNIILEYFIDKLPSRSLNLLKKAYALETYDVETNLLRDMSISYLKIAESYGLIKITENKDIILPDHVRLYFKEQSLIEESVYNEILEYALTDLNENNFFEIEKWVKHIPNLIKKAKYDQNLYSKMSKYSELAFSYGYVETSVDILNNIVLKTKDIKNKDSYIKTIELYFKILNILFYQKNIDEILNLYKYQIERKINNFDKYADNYSSDEREIVFNNIDRIKSFVGLSYGIKGQYSKALSLIKNSNKMNVKIEEIAILRNIATIYNISKNHIEALKIFDILEKKFEEYKNDIEPLDHYLIEFSYKLEKALIFSHYKNYTGSLSLFDEIIGKDVYDVVRNNKTNLSSIVKYNSLYFASLDAPIYETQFEKFNLTLEKNHLPYLKSHDFLYYFVFNNLFTYYKKLGDKTKANEYLMKIKQLITTQIEALSSPFSNKSEYNFFTGLLNEVEYKINNL